MPRDQQQGQAPHKRGSLKSTCAVCSKLFTVAPSKAARGGGMTCSKACRLQITGFGHLIRPALPGTVKQVAEKTGVSLACVRDQLGDMLRAGTIHVAGFAPNEPGLAQGAPKFMPVLALGPSTDPDMPADMRAAVTYHTRKITLAAMPNTVVAIAQMTGMPEPSTLRMVKAMCADGVAHVGSWQRAIRGLPVAVYHAGAGQDQPCRIKKYTQAQKTKRYLRKLKTDETLAHKYDARMSKDRARYWEKAANKRRDPMIEALFGPARRPSTTTETQ